MRAVFRKVGAVVIGLAVAYLLAFIVNRVLSNVLFPGFAGQLELATNQGDRIMLYLIAFAVWLGVSVVTVRFLWRRWTR
jgi:hypothetical protein